MRLFLVLSFLMSCIFFATNGICAEADDPTLEAETQEAEQGKTPDDPGNIPDDKVDIKLIGTTIDDASLYTMGDGERSSLTQFKGPSALLALKNVTPIKQQKRKIVSNGCPAANRFYRIIGRVNNDVITNVDAENKIKFIFFSSGKQYKKEDARLMVEPVARTLIDDKLQQQYAELYSLKVSESEIDSKVQGVATNNSMTVSELADKFEECGINMEIFKKHIKSRMLLQFIVQLIGDAARVTQQEIDEARIKAESNIKQKRYHLLEIVFRVDDDEGDAKVKERAQSILRLVNDGFSFRVMAEAMSQGTYTGDVGDLGWVREDCIEKPVLDAVKTIKIGQASDVIKTRTGYKIVCVVDIAAPGKTGQANASYKVLCSKVQFQGGLLTQKDIEKLNAAVPELKEVSSVAEYKKVCEKHKIEYEERDIASPTEYESALIEESDASGKPAIMKSIDDENSIAIMMVAEKTIPNAELPPDKELFSKVSSDKIVKEFGRNFKKMQAQAHTLLYHDRLLSVGQ
ncbi:MAG: peptidyl-prolyl cis-trans isomerase SurA [Holosporales bacterium]|jgi:peptidyl-prolyl cis-trans isomerase SurA|nr:peptidyl-prolyl cis-trans isomerase SurA [Holosporales bacterium]